jgi:hypothetical protein
MRYYRALTAAMAAFALAAPLAAANSPASATQQAAPPQSHHEPTASGYGGPGLPAPPQPPAGPYRQRAGYRPPTVRPHRGKHSAPAITGHPARAGEDVGDGRPGDHAGALRHHEHVGLAR